MFLSSSCMDVLIHIIVNPLNVRQSCVYSVNFLTAHKRFIENAIYTCKLRRKPDLYLEGNLVTNFICRFAYLDQT